jgi:hypothetical protein
MTTVGVGDKCSVQSKWSPIVKHYGICVGFAQDGAPLFVHNTAEGGVLLTTEQGFASGRLITVEQRAQPGQQAVVAQRALALQGRKYDLLGFNCEHAANLAANGAAESTQVQRVVAAGVGGFLLWLTNENGTSVDRRGYRRDSNGRFASRRWW